MESSSKQTIQYQYYNPFEKSTHANEVIISSSGIDRR